MPSEWMKNLQPASFRGVPFFVQSHTLSGGRRIKDTERFQQRTLTVDNGPELPTFDVVGYVIQNIDNGWDYFNNRDKLIDALQNNIDKNKFNVGTMVHPYYGKYKVHPKKYKVSETFQEGGIARFDITFVLEEDELFPGKITAPAPIMDAAFLESSDISIDSFISKFDTYASFVEELGSTLVDAMMKVQQAVSSINNAVRATIATAIGVVSNSILMIETLLDSPADLYNTLKEGCESFKYVCGMGGTTVQGGTIGSYSGRTYGDSIVLDGESIPQSIGQSVMTQIITSQEFTEETFGVIASTQSKNRTIAINALKFMLLSFACKVMVRIEFESKQQLLIYLDKLLKAFDDLLFRLGDEIELDFTELFVAVEKLRAQVAFLMYQKLETLDSDIVYTSGNEGGNTLELAYNLYKDVDRAEEIFYRNILTIHHPGFIPGNTDLSVLEK